MIVRAVQPLSWMDRNAFLGTVLPIIGNRTEATEVRIAAATALLDSAPTLSELRHLRDVAAEPEANPEVVNFIHTSLQVNYYFRRIFSYFLRIIGGLFK